MSSREVGFLYASSKGESLEVARKRFRMGGIRAEYMLRQWNDFWRHRGHHSPEHRLSKLHREKIELSFRMHHGKRVAIPRAGVGQHLPIS